MQRLAAAEPASDTRKGTVDYLVSSRVRQRRIMLGLTQQQFAELIGVTYQQAHKYETMINRISVSRLYQMDQALGVEIDYFFRDAGPGNDTQTYTRALNPQQRLLLELARNFAMIKSREQQDAVCRLVRALSRRD